MVTKKQLQNDQQTTIIEGLQCDYEATTKGIAFRTTTIGVVSQVVVELVLYQLEQPHFARQLCWKVQFKFIYCMTCMRCNVTLDYIKLVPIQSHTSEDQTMATMLYNSIYPQSIMQTMATMLYDNIYPQFVIIHFISSNLVDYFFINDRNMHINVYKIYFN